MKKKSTDRLLMPYKRATITSSRRSKSANIGKWPKISRLNWVHFLLVTLILLALPIVREWNILLSGERVEGTVIAHRKFNISSLLDNNGQNIRSEIQFTRSDKSYTVFGPENVQYKIGRKVPIIFSESKPDKFILATFSGFYLQKRSVILIIVFIIWLALYSTIVQYQK